jgi:hypothetical protein
VRNTVGRDRGIATRPKRSEGVEDQEPLASMAHDRVEISDDARYRRIVQESSGATVTLIVPAFPGEAGVSDTEEHT